MRRAWLLIGLAACGTAGSGSAGSDATEEDLMAADRAFAVATAERGAEGWASWFAEDGVMFPQHGRVDGRAAILEQMTVAFADTNSRLEWEPVSAMLAGSGDLGYTIGRWTSKQRDNLGAWHENGSGNYVTIWRRQVDGAWKAALDTGNNDPPG